MAKVKFELDTDGVGQLLKSDFVASDVERRASQIASTAGPEWQVWSGPSLKGDRAAALVFTTDPKAIRENGKNHTLMRSIDAGRS